GEGFGEYSGISDRGVCRVDDYDSRRSVALLITQVERVVPGESADADRRAKSRSGLPNVALQFDAIRRRQEAIRKFSRLIGVQILVRRETKVRSPIEPRHRRQSRHRHAEVRKGLVDFRTPGVLGSGAAE